MSRLQQPIQRGMSAPGVAIDSSSSSSKDHHHHPDQKKVYMDWANHYLRKAHYSQTLSDLHECVHGDNLPKIIHAVVQSHVPNVTVAPETEEERLHNIKCCIRHLEATGVNCSSFSVTDLAVSNTKAILSLFYTLSQYKRTSKSAPSSEVPASRIARPVSPGLKNSHGVSSGASPQPLTNGIPSKVSLPAPNRRTAGSSIATSTIDSKPYGARRQTPYKNLILNGEKPPALDSGAERDEGEEKVKAPPGLLPPIVGSTSRLDHMTRKTSIPGVKSQTHAPSSSSSSSSSSQANSSHVSMSQPNLHHHTPSRSKSDPRLLRLAHRRESTTSTGGGGGSSDVEIETGSKTSSLPKRGLKQPSTSASGLPSTTGGGGGRSTPTPAVDRGLSSGRTTPSRLMRPMSKISRSGTGLDKKSSDHSNVSSSSVREMSSDESEVGGGGGGGGERMLSRVRSNSEVRRISMTTTPPRSASRTGGRGLLSSPSGPPGGLNFGVGGSRLQKSAIHSSDSRLASPGSIPHSGDISAGLRSKIGSEKERSFSSSEPGTVVGELSLSSVTTSIGGSLQPPSHHRIPRGQSASSTATAHLKKTGGENEKESEERGGGGGGERPSSRKLSKPSSLQRFGAISPAERKKQQLLPTSGLSKLQQPLSTSQGFIPTVTTSSSSSSSSSTAVGHSSKVTLRGDLVGEESSKGFKSKLGGRPPRGQQKVNASSTSSLEGSTTEDEQPVKLEKQVSTTSSTSSSSSTSVSTVTTGGSDTPKQVTPDNKRKTLAGGKDNRRISPEGMSPDRKTLSNESIEENQKNKSDKTTKLIEDVVVAVGNVEKKQNGTEIGDEKADDVEVGVATGSETQTPNLSQGSEVATDSTLSSLSLASVVSSPPPPSQPETGQAPYSNSSNKHLSSSSPSRSSSHDSHVTFEDKGAEEDEEEEDEEAASLSRDRDFNNPLRSPLAKEKEKAKRARSLSPKLSRRVFPQSSEGLGGSPAVSVSHYDNTARGPISPPHLPSAGDRFTQLDLTRTDSPESVKSDVAVAAYSSSRKPLRSSLRTMKDKDSSSSSLDSGKVHFNPNKVTISPRSSQVVFLPEEAGLQRSAAYSQPTILSPAKRARGRPSSLSDNTSIGVDHVGKRESTASEKMDYSTVEQFLSPSLGHSPSHQRYDSTPELLQTFENELTTMKKDLANKDRMLSMYENSMADLSSKVHNLKKSLEEKDQEIKHLTEAKQTLFDLDSRSLASRMSHANTEVLSDGCLSDSAMEPNHHHHREKSDEKKKKKWKRWSFRRKAKDSQDIHSTMDAESLISGKSGRSYSGLRRNPSKSKTDLMSISEHSPEMRMRDADAKSYISDYGMSAAMMYTNDENITVYDDPNPGAKAPVTLLPGYPTTYSDRYKLSGGDNEGEGTVVLGTISIAPEISWITMDTKICDIFMHHVNSIDMEGSLSLNEDSILHYFIADQRRVIGNALLPPLTPYQSLATGTTVRIVLRGALQDSCDSLAYKTLINSETLQSYISLLNQTQWLVVMGTKGTCKTSLARGLSRHLMQVVGAEAEEEEEGGGEVVVINYDVEKQGVEKVLTDLRESISRKIKMWPHPPIILLDNIYECVVLEQILSTAGNLSRRPFIIATLCTATMQGVPLHQLLFHHRVRVVTCNPQMDPVFGILSRSLRKQIYKLKAGRIEVDPVVERLVQWLPYLLEHLDAYINRYHTQTVSLGPRVFMDCAVDQSRNDLEMWFINLWNHFVIPYLMGAIMAGIETYTADPHLEWVDVREFVIDTYPWQPSFNSMKLRTVNPEDVGWNHAVRPHQNRFLHFKDDMKLPDHDTRSLISRIKPE